MKQFNLAVPWGKLRVTNWGKSYKETSTRVLCLNGFLGGTKSWDFLSKELMIKHDDISIIGYDFPGFGGSTLPNYFFSFELGWEDAHIVGHSNGAELGSIFSMVFPEYCQSLTNVDGFFNSRIALGPDKVVKYEKEVMEHNLKLYKTGTNSYKRTGNLDRFTKPFRILHQEDRFPHFDWQKLAEYNYSDLLVKNENGEYCLEFHSQMFQYLSNSWTYDDREFKNMARRIEFNVNHIKSKVFDEYNGIYQNQKVSFPPDLNYNIYVVKKYTEKNGFTYRQEEIDGPHIIHMTHPECISDIILDTITE